MNDQPLDSAAELRDIRPILQLNDSWPWWIWFLIALAVAAILFFLWRWWVKRRAGKSAAVEALPVTLTAYEWFLQAMQELESLRREPVAFCFRLSFIFREYLERRYQFPATDRTSEEILRDLRRLHHFNDAEAADIRKLFNLIDPVKYAAVLPNGNELAWAEQTVRRLAAQHQNLPPQNQGASHATTAL